MENSKSIHALAYFNLLKTGSWIEEKVKEALKPFNLTHAQLNALHILMEHDLKAAQIQVPYKRKWFPAGR